MEKKGLETASLHHAVAAMYYSWCNLYEKQYPEHVLLAKIHQLIGEDIVLTNIDGTIKGLEKFIQRVLILKKWTNSIHTKAVRVKRLEGSLVALVADAEFQTILPDLSSNSYDVRFHFVLDIHRDFCRIRKLEVENIRYNSEIKFSESYPASRCLAYLHTWLGASCSGFQAEERMKPLIMPGFEVILNDDERIHTTEALAGWSVQLASRISAGKLPAGCHAVTVGTTSLRMKINLELNPQNESKAATRLALVQEWLLHNNPDESHARMKSVHVWEKAVK
jgi:hypothetical protein